MSEPDKKEKPKKKKSVVKEKEENGTLAPGDGDRKASLTPERKGSEKEAKSRKGSSAGEFEAEAKSRRESIQEQKTRKHSDLEPKSRKSSNAEGELSTSRKNSRTPQPEIEEEKAGEADKKTEPSSSSVEELPEESKPVKYYEAPPESTKADIHLLKDFDTRRLAELMEAFSMFDFDQDGVINEYDLKRTFASLDRPDMPDDEIRQMLSEGLNPLDFDAFVILMGYKTLELDAEEVLTDALSQWDYGTEGLISESRIRHDLIAFGDKFTDEEANAALEDAPVILTKNKERMIDYHRFSNDLCGLRKKMKDYKPNK